MSQTTLIFEYKTGTDVSGIISNFCDINWKLETESPSIRNPTPVTTNGNSQLRINNHSAAFFSQTTSVSTGFSFGQTANVNETNKKVDITMTATVSDFMSFYFECEHIQYVISNESFSMKTKALKKIQDGNSKIEVKLNNIHFGDPKKFLNQSDMDDICFIIEDQKIHLNKTILSFASEVFKKMFFTDFKESSQIEINLEGKSIHRFIDFLSTFYDVANPLKIDELVKMSVLRALNLYSLYHEYMMENYIQYCEKMFDDFLNGLQSDNWFNYSDKHSLILQIAIIAEKFDLQFLLNKIVEKLSGSKSSKFKKDELWMELSESFRYKILDKIVDENLN